MSGYTVNRQTGVAYTDEGPARYYGPKTPNYVNRNYDYTFIEIGGQFYPGDGGGDNDILRNMGTLQPSDHTPLNQTPVRNLTFWNHQKMNSAPSSREAIGAMIATSLANNFGASQGSPANWINDRAQGKNTPWFSHTYFPCVLREPSMRVDGSGNSDAGRILVVPYMVSVSNWPTNFFNRGSPSWVQVQTDDNYDQVYVNTQFIGDENAELSILGAINLSGIGRNAALARAPEVFVNITPAVSDTDAEKIMGRHGMAAFVLSGASMGAAVAMACMGGSPTFYTGFFGAVGDDLGVPVTPAQRRAANASGGYNMARNINLVESVDELYAKAAYVYAHAYLLCIPYSSAYRQPVQAFLDRFGSSDLAQLMRISQSLYTTAQMEDGRPFNLELTPLLMGATLAEYVVLASAAWTAFTRGFDVAENFAGSKQFIENTAMSTMVDKAKKQQGQREAAAKAAEERHNVLKPLPKAGRIAQKQEWANSKYDALYAAKQKKVDKAYMEKRQKAVAFAGGQKRVAPQFKKTLTKSILSRGGRTAAAPAGKVLKQLQAKQKARNVESKTGRLKMAHDIQKRKREMGPQRPGAVTAAYAAQDRSAQLQADQQKLDAMTQLAHAVSSMAQNQSAPQSSRQSTMPPTRAQSRAAPPATSSGPIGFDPMADFEPAGVTRSMKRPRPEQKARSGRANDADVASVGAATVSDPIAIREAARQAALRLRRQQDDDDDDDNGGYTEIGNGQ